LDLAQFVYARDPFRNSTDPAAKAAPPVRVLQGPPGRQARTEAVRPPPPEKCLFLCVGKTGL
jgi:hypothetical protein